jgi:hypothetical protein
MRVMFVHGDHQLPEASEAAVPSYLRRRFVNFSMASISPSNNLELRVKAHTKHLLGFKPDVLVGQGEGATAVLTMLQAETWKGPTVILSPAIVPGIDDAITRLPEGVPIIVLSGKHDDEVPVARVEGFWAWNHSRLGDGLRVVTVEDGHSLTKVLDDREPVLFEELGLPLANSMKQKRVTLFSLVMDCWAMRLHVAGPQPYDHDDRFPSLSPRDYAGARDDDLECGGPDSRVAGLAGRYTWRAEKTRQALSYGEDYDENDESESATPTTFDGRGIFPLLLLAPRIAISALTRGILTVFGVARWPLQKLTGSMSGGSPPTDGTSKRAT